MFQIYNRLAETITPQAHWHKDLEPFLTNTPPASHISSPHNGLTPGALAESFHGVNKTPKIRTFESQFYYK